MTCLVIFGTAVLIFTIMYFVPGDPASEMLGADAPIEEVERLRESMGLNDPYPVRLGRFLYDTFVRFDLGTSLTKGTSVWEGLKERIPRTLMIGWISIVISAGIGIPLGVSAAIHQNKWQDTFCIFITMIGSAIPSFWLALMVIILFGLKLHLLPTFGIGTWKHYVLPILANSLQAIAGNARQCRSSMLEVMRADFVTSARAKGVAERDVKYRHMLPNALLPVITVVGGSFGRTIAGAVVIESVFTIPGVGTYMMSAVSNRDYPVVQGSVVFLTVFISLVTLITDLAYGFIDPRIKAQYIGQSAKKKKRRESEV